MDVRSPKRRKIARESPRKPKTRPSYGAPTVASLSRFNPDLVPESRSSPRKSHKNPASNDVLSHVLGAKARRKSMPARPALRASPVVGNDGASVQQHTGDEETVEDDELAEGESAQLETPTVEGGRFREGENPDDLPETPQHLRDRPEYQDTPPKGILSGSLKRRRPRHGRSLHAKSKTPGVATANDAQQSDAQPLEEQPRPSMEDRLRLKARREELSTLREVLRKLENENNEIERHATALKTINIDQDYDELPELITLINRTQSDEPDETSQTNRPTVSDLLTSFLPCSIPVQRLEAAEEEQPIASHDPLPDTPQLLGLFTPFCVTSQLSLPSKVTEKQSVIIQTNTINLAIPNLFSCSLALTSSLDTSTAAPPTISNLELLYVSPFVEREIGTWIRARSSEHDVQCIGYGLGRYWDINVKRARVWSQLMRRCRNLKPRVTNALDRGDESIGEQYAQSQADDDEAKLVSYLGRGAFVCSDDTYALTVRWQLGIDEIGDAESRVSLRIHCKNQGVNAKTQKFAMLAQKSFNQLLNKDGVSVATLQIINAIFV